MPTKACCRCKSRLALSLFVVNSQVCMLCNMREQFEDKIKLQNDKLTTSEGLISELKQKVDALTERIQNHQCRCAVVASSTETTLPTPDSPASVRNDVENTAASSATTLPPPAAPAPAPVSTVDDGFIPVRRAGRTMRPIIQPTVCSNRFQILEEEDEPASTILIGDSMIRQQLTEFCGRVRRSRRVFCMPGAGIDDVTNMVDKVSAEATAQSLFVIHAGTNDVRKTRSEELLNKYRKLIQKYKTKSRNIMLSGVLPRLSADDLFYNKAFSLNSRLRNLCKNHGVEFVDMWNDFYNKAGLFQSDGLHLSAVGAARFGRLLNEAVRGYWAKNGAAPVANVTP